MPATHKAAAAAAAVNLISEEVEWAKYKQNKVVAVDHCDRHVIEAHVVMSFACVGDGAAAKSLGLRAETVTVRPSRLSHVNQCDQRSHGCVIGLTTVRAGTIKRIQMLIPV